MNPQLGISIHNVGLDFLTKYKFKRAQLCHEFSGAREITSLLKLSRKYPIKISYHAPVFHQIDPTVTYYLNSNSRLREATFEILEVNLKMAQSLPTDHVVIHFTSKDIDCKADDDTLYSLANDSVRKLDELSRKYNMPIHLEYAGDNHRFYKVEDWVNLVKGYKNLGICIDTGHLYASCEINHLDYYDALMKLIPVTKAIHLWNTRGIEDIQRYGHVPVHPEQRAEDGWIDIEGTLNMILQLCGNIPIIFEPDFIYGDMNYAFEGIEWINNIINSWMNTNLTQQL